MKQNNITFLSYDGMTDPLGQSQVIPYLSGLSKKGFAISIISFEKKERFELLKSSIQNLLDKNKIKWHPLPYTSKPPILSTIIDIWKLNKKVKEIHSNTQISILHCRSYITSLVGLGFKLKHKTGFIFDMRAFYADERVDGGIWNLSKPIYKIIYNYFKKKEKEFLSKADFTISLTKTGKNIIQGWKEIPNQPVPIEVIPCCADLNHFNYELIKEEELNLYYSKLELLPKIPLPGNEDEIVVSYLGSMGTWYMEKEMFAFFKCLKSTYPFAKFLIITPDSAESIYKKALQQGVSKEDLRIIFGNRNEVPYLLSLSHFALFFIQPLFSKQGSSPTKHGEILGMGIPVICNAGVGDVQEIVETSTSGILIKDFKDNSYQNAISKIPELLKMPKEHFRDAAFQWYSLEKGIERYASVYETILNKKSGPNT